VRRHRSARRSSEAARAVNDRATSHAAARAVFVATRIVTLRRQARAALLEFPPFGRYQIGRCDGRCYPIPLRLVTDGFRRPGVGSSQFRRNVGRRTDFDAPFRLRYSNIEESRISPKQRFEAGDGVSQA
jgi:hypothetical protein